MSLAGIRGWVYGVFGVIMLSTLWVTSLTTLSDRANATALLTEAGAHILNPFLVDRSLGLGQDTYAALEAQARARPSQPLTFQLLKARVLGREIIGHSYPDVVRLVYSRVAAVYYDGGPGAAFAIPPELQQVLPNFGLFNPNNLPILPGGPTVSQLPPFLKPFFTFVGLTPATFTAAGHQSLLSLLPWFWIAAVVLGVLTILLNRSEQRLAGLAQSVVHSSWPIVGVLVGLLIASATFEKDLFAPYVGVLGVVSRAFLPVYGAALVVGLVVVGLTRLLPAILRRQQGTGPAAPPQMPPEAAAALGAMGLRMPPMAPPAGEPQPRQVPPPAAGSQG
jgi:hypothetical protein